MGPKVVRSSVLSIEQEVMKVQQQDV